MLKREIKYTDFDGNETSDIFYFNLTKSEIVEFEVGVAGGMSEYLQKIVKEEDNQALFAEFKKIVLSSYGQKSPDGKRFVKNDALREEFSQTAAFDALVMELMLDEGVAAAFIQGIMPADMPKEDVRNLPPPNIVPAETLRGVVDTTATDPS